MKSNKLVQLGRIILSFLFVFGAVSKLVSMPFFDGMVAELLLGKDYFNNPSGMIWVQWLTRILVTAELVLGLALLQNKWFKKLVLPATMAMLILFTIHLFYEGFSQVNGFTEGNCGCFGDVLPMTNLESIIKNVIGMLAGIFVWIKYRAEDTFGAWVGPIFLGSVTLFTLSFGVKSYEMDTPLVSEILNIAPEESIPEVVKDSSNSNDQIVDVEDTVDDQNDRLPPPPVPIVEEDKPAIIDDRPPEVFEELAPIAKNTPSEFTIGLFETFAPESKTQNLKNSNKLVCLFSMTCSHCQEVYRDLVAMKASGKLPNLYLINYGTEYEQNYFFSQAGGVKSPHTRTEEFPDFKRMLEGNTYPRLLNIKNGKVLKEWNVDTYQRESFMKHFGIEKLEEKKDGGLQLELEGGDSPW